MKGKKKKNKNRKKEHYAITEEAQNEMIAMRYIYTDTNEFTPHPDAHGFTLRLKPSIYGDDAENHVSVDLDFKYTKQYPEEPLALKVHNAAGMGPDDLRQLAVMVHDFAAGCAATKQVYVQDVAMFCLDQLVELNAAAAARALEQQQQQQQQEEQEQEEGQEQDQSLWHAMQQREALKGSAPAAAEARGTEEEDEWEMGTPFLDLWDFTSVGLFDDEPADPVHIPQLAPRPQPNRRALATARPPTPRLDSSVPVARTSGVATSISGGAEAGTNGVPAATATATATDVEDSASPEPDAKGDGRPSAGALPAQDSGPALPSMDSLVKASDTSSNASAPPVNRVLRGLYTMLHKLGSLGPHSREASTIAQELALEAASTLAEAGGAGSAGATQAKSQMLLAHLLLLSAQQGAAAAPGVVDEGAAAVHLLARHLQDAGVLEKWVVWLMVKHPKNFDQAFRRMFAKEIDGVDQVTEADGSLALGVLQRFWSREPLRTGPELTPMLGSHLNSRYLTDFVEGKRLGKGGFGVVVAAVNRLDGRQYAIKKIPLDNRSLSHARIMREVNTLSRLQHPNIVRYFQAWCEAVEDDFSDDEDGEWGSGTGTSYSLNASRSQSRTWQAGGRRTSTMVGMGEKSLTPVKEVSREVGGTSSDEEGRWKSGDHSVNSKALRAFAKKAQAGKAKSKSESGSESGSGSGSTEESESESGSGSEEESGTGSSSGSESESGDGDEDDSEVDDFDDTDTGTISSNSGTPWYLKDTSLLGKPKGSGSGSKKASTSKALRRKRYVQTLHIQMEFCPRTLSTVLEKEQLEEEDRWWTLRGILSGLNHLHGQGVIHRDLKPANVFYDAKGEIKIGDFGLAKFSSGADDAVLEEEAQAESPTADGQQRPGVLSGVSDTTGVCGTSYYISPEIANKWANYDEKVDIFSLGVVVFELWHPFATAMERAMLLRNLRGEAGPQLPPAWEAANPNVAKLVRWLLKPLPTDRPTAKEVLASELLPQRVESEQVATLLRSLPDNPDTYEQVVEAVFAASRAAPGSAGGAGSPTPLSKMATPLAVPLQEVAGAPHSSNVRVRDQVVKTIKRVFVTHGAIGMASKQVGLVHQYLSPDTVKLLSPNGTQLALRSEMRQPFAAQLAYEAAIHGSTSVLDVRRRYEISWVMRKGRARGLPASNLQADLDLVAPNTSSVTDRMLLEAEALAILAQIADAFPNLPRSEMRVNHRLLHDSVRSTLGIPPEVVPHTWKLLVMAAAASPSHPEAREKVWPGIRAGLLGLKLPAEAVERCRKCVLELPGPLHEKSGQLRQYLRSVYRKPLAAPLEAALKELEVAVELAGYWGLASESVFLDPLMMPHTDYYSGVLLQMDLRTPDGATTMLAAGGRYDKLLRELWAPAAAGCQPPGAVGLTLNVERFVHAHAPPAGAQNQGVAASQAQVAVCSKGSLKHRMAVLASLWAAGIKAETVPQERPSLREQYDFCHSRGIRWLVIVDDARYEADGVAKVKSLDKGKTEEVVHTTDLPRYLQAALNGAQDLSRALSVTVPTKAPAGRGAAASTLDSASSQDHDDPDNSPVATRQDKSFKPHQHQAKHHRA